MPPAVQAVYFIREGESLLFPVPADQFPVPADQFPVPAKTFPCFNFQGIPVQDIEINT
jgi:hypothetical protein